MSGHAKILHTLIKMGSAALEALTQVRRPEWPGSNKAIQQQQQQQNQPKTTHIYFVLAVLVCLKSKSLSNNGPSSSSVVCCCQCSFCRNLFFFLLLSWRLTSSQTTRLALGTDICHSSCFSSSLFAFFFFFFVVKCCFTSTETVGLLGTGAQDGYLDFHTAPDDDDEVMLNVLRCQLTF